MTNASPARTDWSNALLAIRKQAPVLTRLRATTDHTARITRNQLDEAYDQIRETVDLAADHPEDGCYARSEVLCRELDRRGLESEKAFVTPLFKQLRTADM